MGASVCIPAINRILEVLWFTAKIAVEVREAFSSPISHICQVLHANLPLPFYISFSLLKTALIFAEAALIPPKTQVIPAAPLWWST